MSTAAILTTAVALWPSLRRVLVRVGRWLIRRVVNHGVERVLGFMQVRIETFRGRRERARSPRRTRWLTGRIRRWTQAMAWLRARASQLQAKVAAELDAMAESARLPWDADGEIYERWVRAGNE